MILFSFRKFIIVVVMFLIYSLANAQVYVGVIGSNNSVEETSNFDADYQAVLDKATSLSYTLPSVSQQTVQNQLVLDLKSDGIWSELDVFYLFANDGSEGFATLNWIDPDSYQITVNGLTSWTSDEGFDGAVTVADYLDTSFAPSDAVEATTGELSMNIYLNTLDGNLTGAHMFAGTRTTTSNQIVLGYHHDNDDIIYMANSSVEYDQFQSDNYTGMLATVRSESQATNTAYTFVRGALSKTNATNAPQTFSTEDISILAVNQSGTLNNSSDVSVAFFSFGSSMYDLQDEFEDIIDTYIQGL